MKKILLLLLALIPVLSVRASESAVPSALEHFVWGAEAGGAIDLTSNDMSTINLDAIFGYKSNSIDVLGIGAGVNMMVSNATRSFPVYALLRTGFSSRPTLLFMDLRAGCVFNNVTYSKQTTRLYLSPGIGINLARGRSFTSYLALSYVYNGMRSFQKSDEWCDINGLSMACVRLGISF